MIVMIIIIFNDDLISSLQFLLERVNTEGGKKIQSGFFLLVSEEINLASLVSPWLGHQTLDKGSCHSTVLGQRFGVTNHILI